jgi:hypothetical protein
MVQKQADKNSSKNKGLKKLFLLFVFFQSLHRRIRCRIRRSCFICIRAVQAIDITAPLRDFEIVLTVK